MTNVNLGYHYPTCRRKTRKWILPTIFILSAVSMEASRRPREIT